MVLDDRQPTDLVLLHGPEDTVDVGICVNLLALFNPARGRLEDYMQPDLPARPL
ncbi:hypothetical protein GCM10022206_13620 [Streptomyces chiangmaiensis]